MLKAILLACQSLIKTLYHNKIMAIVLLIIAFNLQSMDDLHSEKVESEAYCENIPPVYYNNSILNKFLFEPNFVAYTISPNQKFIACSFKEVSTISEKMFIRIYNLETGELLNEFEHRYEENNKLIFSPESNKLISTYFDGIFYVFDLNTQVSFEINWWDVTKQHENYIQDIFFSDDSNKIIISSTNSYCWDIATQTFLDE